MSDELPSHPVFAALYDPVTRLAERRLRPHREWLARDLSGAVLDVGAGTGAMFPYLCASADEAVELHAIEPDLHMRERARERARELDCAIDVRDARAESLPYPDDAFDVIVAAVVFCTIGDPDRALDELARVLDPEGEIRFLEHVRAPGWRGRLQGALTPCWRRVAGGCELDRPTVRRFAGHSGLALAEHERLDLGVTPVAPVVRGRLRPVATG